jgi:hypothetical protein
MTPQTVMKFGGGGFVRRGPYILGSRRGRSFVIDEFRKPVSSFVGRARILNDLWPAPPYFRQDSIGRAGKSVVRAT